MKNTKIQQFSQFRNMPGGREVMHRTVGDMAGSGGVIYHPIAEQASIESTQLASTYKGSTVHQRRCKADDTDELLLDS